MQFVVLLVLVRCGLSGHISRQRDTSRVVLANFPCLYGKTKEHSLGDHYFCRFGLYCEHINTHHDLPASPHTLVSTVLLPSSIIWFVGDRNLICIL